MTWNHRLQFHLRFNEGRHCRRIRVAGGVIEIMRILDFVADQRPSNDPVDLGHMAVSVTGGTFLSQSLRTCEFEKRLPGPLIVSHSRSARPPLAMSTKHAK